MELGGANLVTNPRPVKFSVESLNHDRPRKLAPSLAGFGRLSGRRRGRRGAVMISGAPWCKLEAVVQLGPRGGSGGVVRVSLEGRGYNLQDGLPSVASETVPRGPRDGDALASTAKEYRKSMGRLTTTNEFADRDFLQTRDVVLAPQEAGRILQVGRSRPASIGYGDSNVANSRFQHSQQNAAEYMAAGAPSTVSSIAKAAIPLLLIAPVLGFCARCMVDYIHTRVEEEVSRQFAEMESRRALHRPRVKRWQGILDEDRDEDYLELLEPSEVPEYQSDSWSRIFRQPASVRDSTEVPSDKETEEERQMRQNHDYEALQKSYNELGPLYEKFLADSGLSRSGYWRGASES